MSIPTKIGILIPQSKQYKTLDRDFIRGIKLNNLNVQYYVESIGIGANEQLIIDKIQKLYFQEGINIIIGFFGHHNMQRVYEYASDNDILLLASDIGATVPYAMKKQKGICINSYGLTESCYLLGQHFSDKQYDKIASSTSYYDSGYGMLSAMENALNKSDITISGHYITPFYPRENEAECMQLTLEHYNPEVVFAFYSGLYAEENASFINHNKVSQKYTFYTTPFAINETIVNEYQNNNLPLYVVASWFENFARTSDCTFHEQFKAQYDEPASVFAMLGYENGAVLAKLLETVDQTDTRTLLQYINTIQVEGPRGMIQFHPETNRTKFDHYIYKLERHSDDQVFFDRVETLVNEGHFIEEVTQQEMPPKIGGWQNAYLCH
ncbi:ABC transporter substrate-binding protein [Flavobacterium sp. WV_118_3]|uniref:ABC transporter substrate-binding protein n=1 Tax=Flavobacterium sp. WV_118_3 TaxID=3151764 RepID=UPI0032192227